MKKYPGAGLVMSGMVILLLLIVYAERWVDSLTGMAAAAVALAAAGVLLRLGDRASARG